MHRCRLFVAMQWSMGRGDLEDQILARIRALRAIEG